MYPIMILLYQYKDISIWKRLDEADAFAANWKAVAEADQNIANTRSSFKV